MVASHATSWCSIVPEYLLHRIVSDEGTDSEAGGAAEKTIKEGRDLFTKITMEVGVMGDETRNMALTFGGKPPPATALERYIYTAEGTENLPGTLSKSDSFTSRLDQATTLYVRLGRIHEFFHNVFGWKLFDNKGHQLHVTIDYGDKCMNAYWNGSQIVLGQGSPVGLDKFWLAIDVLAHEITHGIIQHTSALDYRGETGALNEHLADVFGLLFKQYYRTKERNASEASWVIGDQLFTLSVDKRHDELKPQLWTDGNGDKRWVVPGAADDSCYMIQERTLWNDHWARGYLRSFENPKSSNPPQPIRYRDYEALQYDNGGVHHNSGIPNRAFHKAAVAAGGRPWDGVGRVWFHAMTDPKLQSNSKFADFAALTIAWADTKYPHLKDAIIGGWDGVGVVPTLGTTIDEAKVA
jgi:Zn-dependent metalloprotease